MQTQHQEIEEKTDASISSLEQKNRKTTEALRVTPEEVALAAAALEAKREAEHNWRETTLPLDEAIQHLGLNAIPQDLAPEVVALRAEKKRRAAQAVEEQNYRTLRKGFGGFMLVMIPLAISVFFWLERTSPVHSAQAAPAMTMLPIQKLAAVPDNVPVHIDVDTLLKLAKNDVTPENISVDTRPEAVAGVQSANQFNNEWTLVKSQGEIQVRGWATVEFALNISNGSPGAIFSARPGWLPANNLLPVQIAVSRLEGQNYARFLADGKNTDSASQSILMESNVADTDTVAKDLVSHALASLPTKPNAQTASAMVYFDVDVKGNVVRLTGRAVDADQKQRAGEIAGNTLKRLRLPYTVSNDLYAPPATR